MKFLATLSAFLMIPLTVSAQESSTGALTGTGTVVGTPEQRLEREQWEKREARIEGFRGEVLRTRTALRSFLTQESLHTKKRSTHRRECAVALRQANRDQKFPSQKRCYRGELSLDIERLRRLKQKLPQLPGVTKVTLENAISVLDSLLDAEATIVHAIDVGVYEEEGHLLEAKENLTKKYREPLWNALARVRNDQMLAWIAQLLHWIRGIEDEEPPVLQEITKARLCLEGEETAMEGGRPVNFTQALLCTVDLHTAIRLREELKRPIAPPAPPPPSKDLRRVRSIKL